MPESPDPDNTPETVLFDKIAIALHGSSLEESESVLGYMLTCVALRRRQGLPAAGVKAELADLLGRAVDSLTSEHFSP
jgi:hypothetical protein